MGCGSSGQVLPTESSAEEKVSYGNGATTNGTNNHSDDLPTLVLPETPKPKAPVAYDIPIEEFDGNKRPSTPPAHLQRLLQPPAADITLPHIQDKLAEAEQRRLSILQQRAASAHKRTQRMTKSFNETIKYNETEQGKHKANVVCISPERGVCEGKDI